MRYRFAFGVTREGYLRIIAKADGKSPLTSVHHDSDVFAHTVAIANIREPQSLELVSAAARVFNPTSVSSCCESVELNDEELKRLRLHPDQTF